MKRALGIVLVLGIFATAMALSTFSKVFQSTYHIAKDSNLGSHPCLVCHDVEKPKSKKTLNKYGLDVLAAMKDAGSKKVTADILHSIENKNAGGKKFIDLIKADKFPGGNE